MIKDLENIILVASDELQSFVDKNRDDLSWDSYRPKGGQQVGIVRSDMTLTHMPTGITVIADEFRSQHYNRSLAILKLVIKLNELR